MTLLECTRGARVVWEKEPAVVIAADRRTNRVAILVHYRGATRVRRTVAWKLDPREGIRTAVDYEFECL